MNLPRAARSATTLAALFASLSLTLISSSAAADTPLRFEELPSKMVRIDGVLREWPDELFQSLGRGADAAGRFALGYDDAGIYVAAEIIDSELVRNRRPGASDDGVRLTIIDAGEGAKATHIYLFPALASVAPAGVHLGDTNAPRSALSRAKIVESRLDTGYIIEAFIPFRDLRDLKDFPRARGAFAIIDVDPGRPKRVVSTATGENYLPIEGTGGELGAFTTFLKESRLRERRVRLDERANVYGGRKNERIALVDGTLFVSGADFGDASAFQTLSFRSLLALHEYAFEDLTGDGRAELFLRIKTDDAGGERDEAWVITFEKDGPKALIRVPYSARVRGGRVHGEAKLEARTGRNARGPKLLTVRALRAEGVDESSITQDEDEVSLILPFGPIAARQYAFDRGTLKLHAVEANRGYRDPALRDSTSGASEDARRERPTGSALIEAARADLGLSSSLPVRYEQTANVAEDGTPETLAIIGKRLIIAGPGFRGGAGYFSYEFGVSSPEDIVHLGAMDVDGDGKREIIVCVRQDLGQGVTRTLLLIHRLSAGGFTQIHGREIARQYQGNTIVNRYRVSGSGKARRLIVSPGEAKGFTQENWPFGTIMGDPYAPLLLPWADREQRLRL